MKKISLLLSLALAACQQEEMVNLEENLSSADFTAAVEDFSTETALVVAEIYRHNGEWKFKAVGSGYNGGLRSLCSQYGVDVE